MGNGGDLGVGVGGSVATDPGYQAFPTTACDDDIDLEDTDPLRAAKAIELCDTTTASEATPGLIEAKYVRSDGSPAKASAQFGIQTSFGPNVLPKAGKLRKKS